MSGTSSTQPGPTEAAPLTTEQRKAYAPQRLTCPMCDFVFMRQASEYVCETCWTFYANYAKKEQPK